jgi:S-adenosylmethionine:tRNA ribosyltransferase-isomerase
MSPDSATQNNLDQLLAAYDYDLPEERIAQNPVEPRDSARLLVLNSANYRHHQFRDLPSLLQPGDLLVLNNTRVIPARLLGRKRSHASGPLAPKSCEQAISYGDTLRTPTRIVDAGETANRHQLDVEVLLLEEQQNHCWLALVRPGKRLKPGAYIEFGSPGKSSLGATVLETDSATGGRILQFSLPEGESLQQALNQLGQIPLPPYIRVSQAQPDQYQTIYATRPGAVAAPTAGLHFTPDLLDRLEARGIQHAFVTLHVGVGTFRPVEAANITTHTMHGEWVEVSEETVQQIYQTQARGGRVIAVGTTVARALEGAAQDGKLRPYQGKTDLFIYPGYQWQVVEGLITNFHLPRSSLLMLVSALVGRQRLMDLYQVAIAQQYRFYSFGDAMLILPSAKI